MTNFVKFIQDNKESVNKELNPGKGGSVNIKNLLDNYMLINDGIKQINEQLDIIMKETPIKVRLLNETGSNTHLAFIKYIIGVNSLFLEFSDQYGQYELLFDQLTFSNIYTSEQEIINKAEAIGETTKIHVCHKSSKLHRK